MSEKASMDADLTAKYERLALLNEQPAFGLAEYFASIRKDVDCEAERLLEETDGDEVSKLNKTRERFIQLLDALEKRLTEKTTTLSSSSSKVYASLQKRVDAFVTDADAFSDLNDTEDAYVQLALDIMDATNELERSLLGNRSIVYVPSRGATNMGILLYSNGYYLNQIESDCLKNWTKHGESFDVEDIHKETQKSLNKSLVVGVCQPLIVVKSMSIIYEILSDWNRLPSDTVIYFGDTSKADFDELSSLMTPFNTSHKSAFNECATFSVLLDGSTCSSIEGIRVSTAPFNEHKFALNIIVNRSIDFDSFFQVSDSFFESLSVLALPSSRLKTLNEAQLAKCIRLEYLTLTDSLVPEAKFNIGFLASCGLLRELQLMLPDAPIDLAVLKSLKNLTELKLASPTALDSSKACPELTDEAFKQISAVSRLRRLELSHFRIESIRADLFSDFKELRVLYINHGPIGHIQKEAFKNTCIQELELVACELTEMPDGPLPSELIRLNLSMNRIRCLRANSSVELSELIFLDLSRNEIDELSAGSFGRPAGFSKLNYLDLSHNSVREIRCGVFDKMDKLLNLALDGNPLERVEAYSFRHLTRLPSMTLDSCQLKTIDSRAFYGLESLVNLILSNNQIESIEPPEEEHESMPTKRTRYQDEEVNQSPFGYLKSLKTLSLRGNRLQKFDFNCLNASPELHELNLSDNAISQLNRQIQPGVLANLTFLFLNCNQLTFIDHNALSNSTNLVELDLSNNKLEKLDDQFFQSFQQLERLRLQSNNLSMTITNATFSRCEELIEINLLDNLRIMIENNALEGLHELKILKLELVESFVGLSEFDANSSLSDLGQDIDTDEELELVEIACHKSNPEIIEAFVNSEENQAFLYRIQRLSLVESSIESLEGLGIGWRFESMCELDLRCRFENLQDLNLSKNKIAEISASHFVELKNLTHLDLSGNLIESLDDPYLMQSLLKLKSLDLSRNKLKHIHRRLFKGLSLLESLNISNNPTLKIIDSSILRGLFNLLKLNLSGNNIDSLNLPLIFRSCRLLESLDLSDNQLDNKFINEESVSGSTAQNLKELLLANNRLERMDFVYDLYRLEKLDLSGNKVESVTANGVNLLGRCINLNHLDLSNNPISPVDQEIVSRLRDSINYFDVS